MKCRLCNDSGEIVFELSPTPIANSFPARPDADAERFPLRLQQCTSCGHVQLADPIKVEWRDYKYATPEAVRPHLAESASELRRKYPKATDVLEIGSNNGMFLQELRKVGFRAMGVDPTTTDGLCEPFTERLAVSAFGRGMFNIVVANNVLAHVDDLQDCLKGIDWALHQDGIFVFEVQYLPAMVEKGAFDMIYHEHRDYHSLWPLINHLGRFNLCVRDYEFLPQHGGSVRVWCDRMTDDVTAPDDAKIDWKAFRTRIDLEGERIRSALSGKKNVAMLGATAKATTLVHNFGLQDSIAYCMDSTPGKRNCHIPGTNIRICGDERMKFSPPDAVLLTAWNYEDHIRAKYPGLDFIVPFTKPQALKEVA